MDPIPITDHDKNIARQANRSASSGMARSGTEFRPHNRSAPGRLSAAQQTPCRPPRRARQLATVLGGLRRCSKFARRMRVSSPVGEPLSEASALIIPCSISRCPTTRPLRNPSRRWLSRRAIDAFSDSMGFSRHWAAISPGRYFSRYPSPGKSANFHLGKDANDAPRGNGLGRQRRSAMGSCRAVHEETSRDARGARTDARAWLGAQP